MFLPGNLLFTGRFDWKFLDFGIVYQTKNGCEELYNPICPAAKLDLYKFCPLPQAYLNVLAQDKMDGKQFEEVLFQQLIRLSNVMLETTDLAGRNTVHLNYI